LNKRIAIPVITVLAIAVIATGYFVVQQSNKLGEAGSEIVALEDNVSALEENVSTLEESGSVLEVKLTDLEAKVSTLEVALEEANDDVELQQKLVGWGGAGLAPGNRAWIATTNFSLINPDCVSEITIERVSVFKADGTLIYEGPPLVGLQGTEWTLPLEPHQSIDMLLTSFVVAEGTVDPLDFPDFSSYTIEVFWTGPKGGLPLTGWSWMLTINIDAEGNAGIPSTSAMTQMVNMEQALDSEDKD